MASPTIHPLHAQHLALLQMALLALLHFAADEDEPNDIPDGITCSFDGTSVEVEYTRGGIPVAGEAV